MSEKYETPPSELAPTVYEQRPQTVFEALARTAVYAPDSPVSNTSTIEHQTSHVITGTGPNMADTDSRDDERYNPDRD